MRLIAQDGTSLILHPLRYQLAAGTGPADDRWLVIGGHLRVADRSWSFEDPCLRIDEAYELSAWLLRAARLVLRQAATQWAYELDSLPPREPGAGQAPP